MIKLDVTVKIGDETNFRHEDFVRVLIRNRLTQFVQNIMTEGGFGSLDLSVNGTILLIENDAEIR